MVFLCVIAFLFIFFQTEFSEGEWQFFISLTEPVPARYVQFVPDDDDGGSLMLNNLQITGCRLG